MRHIAYHQVLDLQAGSGALGLATWRCDLADDALTWSAGVYDLFGLAHGERVDRRDAVAMYDDASRASLHQLRAQAIATGYGFSLDARILAADGVERWMRIIAEVVREHGRSVALHGIKRDITAQVARWGSARV